MKLRIFCRRSWFPPWSGKDLINTPVYRPVPQSAENRHILVLDPVLYSNDFQPRWTRGSSIVLYILVTGCVMTPAGVGMYDGVQWTVGGVVAVGYWTAVGTSDRPKTTGLSSSERLNCDPL